MALHHLVYDCAIRRENEKIRRDQVQVLSEDGYLLGYTLGEPYLRKPENPASMVMMSAEEEQATYQAWHEDDIKRTNALPLVSDAEKIKQLQDTVAQLMAKGA